MNAKTVIKQFAKLNVNPEGGQAIVIIALAMVALLGSLGLAIDGGGLFFLQRDAQNATDAAVIAGTYARCTGALPDDVIAAGYAAAAANGFINSSERTVIVNNPPLEGEKAGDNRYVEVQITAAKPSYFIQLVYRGPLQVSTRAVGYCDPPFDPSTVPAAFGISETCGDTVNWTGSEGYIEGGMFSNNEVKLGGGGQDNTIVGGAEAVVQVQTSAADNNTFTPAPVYPVPKRDDPLYFQFGDYAPDGNIARSIQNSATGIYKSILSSADDADYKDGNKTWDVNNRTLEGLYYVEGNVKLGNNITYGAEGVSIVATGKISGTNISIRYYSPAGGILFFSNEATNCGSNAIDVSGNSTNWFGVIYAPNGGVNASGSSLSMYGAIVANTINLSGSQLRLVADPTILPPRPPLVKIAE